MHEVFFDNEDQGKGCEVSISPVYALMPAIEAKDYAITKDGHTMFWIDVVKDLNYGVNIIEKLNRQIEAMRCCDNCGKWYYCNDKEPLCDNYSNWTPNDKIR